MADWLVATRATEQARLSLAQLPTEAPLNLAFCLACEVAAKAIEVERVGVWLFIDDGAALRCAMLFERSKKEHSSGSILRVADFPAYFGSLNIRKAVPAEIAANDPRTLELAAAYLDPLGITSMLDAGIFVDGDMVGVVCHEHVGPPREWTTEARDFAGSIADLLALRIQSAKALEWKAALRAEKDRSVTMQKAQALQQIAGGIAHDFTNILAIVRGKAELLIHDQTLTADTRQQARDIVMATERGHAMTKELREFARPTPRPPTALDVAEAATEFLPLLRGAVGRRHEVSYERSPSVGRVLIDKTQFTRVLLNLTLNARDAMPDGGTICVRLAPVKLTIGEAAAGNHILLVVSDQGVGMDESTRRQALDPFFTTKSEGTGLGLAVVQHIIDQAGGLIRIESAPGKGTTVRVCFPCVGAGAGGAAEFVLPMELRSHAHE